MSQETKKPKPKRRWLRFSLRTFLIVLTIFCVWLGWFLYRVEQQREAVRWVITNGGEVYYDYELYPEDEHSPVPKWLHDMLGVDYFSTVTQVGYLETQVSDVTPLATLKNLRGLYLNKTQVSDVTPLAGLTNLKELWLNNTQVNDLTPIAGLTNLEVLMLFKTHVSDVTPLAGLTNLKELWLLNTQVSVEEIEKLKLALPSCHITY